VIKKMKGSKGAIAIDFSEQYDQEDDIYYVTFKTGEPSYVVEIDDVLLIEVGIFTQMPTGFRLLNFTKSKVGNLTLLVAKIEKALAPAKIRRLADFRARETQVERVLEKVLA
jgi:hypothetical protein